MTRKPAWTWKPMTWTGKQFFTVSAALTVICLNATYTHAQEQEHWPQFRGRNASGLGSGNPPLTWNVETGENVAWSVAIGGLGHSSPVSWGDRIFLTTAVNSVNAEPALEAGWLDGTGDPAADEGEWTWQVLCIDMNRGKVLWTLGGGGDVPVPTPLFDDGLIFLTNGHGRSPTFAISQNARGDLTPAEDASLPAGLVWHQPRNGSYMPTPIVVDGRLYTCNDNGRLTVRDCKTGEEIYKRRIDGPSGTHSASAVSAGGNIFFSNETGHIIVIRAGDEYQLVAENDVGEPVLATPSLAGDRMLIRGVKHLFCIAKPE